jgi:protein-tyrosine phosphatase
MDISAKAVKFKKHSRYIAQIKTLIAHKDVDIADFITWNLAKFKRMVSYNSYGYVVAYCMIYFLMQKDENILIGMMRDMRNGQSSALAFDLHYPGGLLQFEKDFFAYFK